MALIRESNGQKAIFTWFGGYFEQEANKFFDNSSPETFINLGANANSSLEEMIEQTSDKWLDIITQKALKYMMQQAKVESGIKTNRDKYKDAYKDLTSRIGNFSTPGSLAADMNKIYGITDMTKEIVTEITSNINKNNKKLKLSSILVGKNKADGTAGWGAHKKGSFAMESWVNNIVISKLNNLNAHSFRADGPHGSARADLVSMFDVNINLSLAEKWIREEVTNYREKNIALNNDFINKLSMLSDDGYIVYTSAKNYVLDNKHDMAAGEAMTISSFLNTISRV